MYDRDLSIAELAEVLGMSERWVRKQINAHAIPCHRRGRAVRFTPEDVARIREMGEQPAMSLRRADDGGPSYPPPQPSGPTHPAPPPRLRAVS